jgi:hypothetical protein
LPWHRATRLRAREAQVLEEQARLRGEEQPADEWLVAGKCARPLPYSEVKTGNIEALGYRTRHEHRAVIARPPIERGAVGHHSTGGIMSHDLPNVTTDDQGCGVRMVGGVERRPDLAKLALLDGPANAPGLVASTEDDFRPRRASFCHENPSQGSL